MELSDQLASIAARAQKTLAHIQTEEATKNALILPFINALGYNVFDPTEVVPEYTCDVGTKKGEKVDYAIFRDSKPIMLFECKHVGGDLSVSHAGQLLRYFHVTEARIGVLTNGVKYRFYTDLEKPNVMDERPFLEFDLFDLDSAVVSELKKLTKGAFNLDQMLAAAHDMKYLRALKGYLNAEFSAPSEEFVTYLAKHVYDGKLTAKLRETFGSLVHRALQQFVSERVAARLKSAIVAETGPIEQAPLTSEAESVAVSDQGRLVETTQEEVEGYQIVRAILRDAVPVQRVVMRDVQSYCGVLLDDNNRKPIVRLHLNGGKKYLTVFDTEGGERVDINSLDDLFNVADRLRAAALQYDAKS
jgi:predicted type IV restriction endonuclease